MAELEGLLEAIKESNRWLRVLAAPVLRESLEAQFPGRNDRKIYRLSTGGSSREVARAANVDAKTVRIAWKRWSEAGVVVPTDTEGRFQKIVDLKSIGIEESPSA